MCERWPQNVTVSVPVDVRSGWSTYFSYIYVKLYILIYLRAPKSLIEFISLSAVAFWEVG